VLGPSFLFAVSKKTSLAITSAFRTHLSANNVSTVASTAVFEGVSYYPIRYQQIKMENTKISFGSWEEIGFSYAHVTHDNYYYIHRFGFSVKALFGLAGGYIYDKGYNGWNEDGNSLIFDSSNFSYAYSGPSTSKKYKNTSNSSISLNGIGASFDIGYSVQKNAAAGTRYCPNFYHYGNNSKVYNWKLGISLLDIGAIQFYKNSFATKLDIFSMPQFLAYILGIDKFLLSLCRILFLINSNIQIQIFTFLFDFFIIVKHCSKLIFNFSLKTISNTICNNVILEGLGIRIFKHLLRNGSIIFDN
jgi:hypothetical protein